MRKLGLSQDAVQRIGTKLAQWLVEPGDSDLVQQELTPEEDEYTKSTAIPNATIGEVDKLMQKARSIIQLMENNSANLGEAGNSLMYNLQELVNKLEEDKWRWQEQLGTPGFSSQTGVGGLV